MDFDFSYAPGTSLDQIIGFETAGALWSSYLGDNTTINIYVETTNQLPPNVIGGSLPGILADQKYETWRNKLSQDKTSANDNLVFNNLQDEQAYFTTVIDGYKIDNNEQLNLTRANGKALNMVGNKDTNLDGYILMRDLTGMPVSWNYNVSSSSVPTNSLDFVSVAVHEIGHVLGFTSGLDKAGWLTQKTQYDSSHISDYYSTLVGKLNNATPLDMFRYSAKSIALGGISEHWTDMSIGGNPYFSLDGGRSARAYYGTGHDHSLGGDGNQASHWKQKTNAVDIMDPVLGVGQRRNISTLDREAMDAIGWNLKQGTTDLVTLQNQAKTKLASEIGVTVSWLDANQTSAAGMLSKDRTQDVETMIDRSQVYEWGTSGRKWQEGLWQNVLWQELDLSGGDSEAESSSTTKLDFNYISDSYVLENRTMTSLRFNDSLTDKEDKIDLGNSFKQVNELSLSENSENQDSSSHYEESDLLLNSRSDLDLLFLDDSFFNPLENFFSKDELLSNKI